MAESFDPNQAIERMRVLAGQCANPAMAGQFLGSMLDYAAEVAELGRKSWTATTRQQAVAVLLEAAAAYALNQRGSGFLELLDPLLGDPEVELLDQVFASITDPILRSGQWGTITAALDTLERYVAGKAKPKYWAAYAKALSNVIDALYAMGRYSTSDGLFDRFDGIPAKFQPATRLYHSLALRSKTAAKAKDESLVQVERTLAAHRELFKTYPIDGIRRNLAASVAEAIPVFLRGGDLDGATTLGETLWEMTSEFPEDAELATSWLRFLAAALPQYLACEQADAADPYLVRFGTLVPRYAGVEAVGREALRVFSALKAADAELAARSGPRLVPLLKTLRRCHRRSEEIGRGIDELTDSLGLPRVSAGCLGALLTFGLVSSLS